MMFDSEKIKEIISEFLSEDCFGFELENVVEIVDANVTFTDNEEKIAYAKGFVIFAECLKEFAQRKIETCEDIKKEEVIFSKKEDSI